VTDTTETNAPSRTRIERYDPASIEPRWQRKWEELELYRTDLNDTSKPRFYLLTMYPYPSGDIHIGHWYIKTPTDAIARFHRMHGENVFLPIGFDASGRERSNQEQHQSSRLDDVEHREHAPPAAVDGRDVRLEC
jgi:leucyl-tRNA synthetase